MDKEEEFMPMIYESSMSYTQEGYQFIIDFWKNNEWFSAN